MSDDQFKAIRFALLVIEFLLSGILAKLLMMGD